MSTIWTLLQAGALGAVFLYVAKAAWTRLSGITHFSIHRRQNPGGGGSVLITWGAPPKTEKRKP